MSGGMDRSVNGTPTQVYGEPSSQASTVSRQLGRAIAVRTEGITRKAACRRFQSPLHLAIQSECPGFQRRDLKSRHDTPAGSEPGRSAKKKFLRVWLATQQKRAIHALHSHSRVFTALRLPADLVGGVMFNTRGWIALGLLSAFAVPAMAQSFRVQCPTSTITHPVAANNDSEPAYTAPTYAAPSTDYTVGKTGPVNGAIKCQQIAGGDGYAVMGDGTQTYLFSFGPLSGIADITQGRPGTEFPSVFNSPFPVSTSNYMVPGDPATSVDTATTVSGGLVQPLTGAQLSSIAGFYNGAVGLDYDLAHTFSIADISESGNTVTVVLNAQSPFAIGDQVVIGQGAGTDLAGYTGTFTVTAVNIGNPFFPNNYAFQYSNPTTGLAEVNITPDGTASSNPAITGHVDARQIMDVGVMNGNIPAPMMAIDEDDEFFLTLTNVGMIMRPDLFEQHTVHFHGYPNASAFYDGVPDASVAINIAASFTYYYLAPDAGTYFWHCHITP